MNNFTHLEIYRCLHPDFAIQHPASGCSTVSHRTLTSHSLNTRVRHDSIGQTLLTDTIATRTRLNISRVDKNFNRARRTIDKAPIRLLRVTARVCVSSLARDAMTRSQTSTSKYATRETYQNNRHLRKWGKVTVG